MRVIHLNKDIQSKGSSNLKVVQKAEQLLQEEIARHLENLKHGFQKEKSYKRLMILYRKTKDSKKEFAILNKAITDFKQNYAKRKVKHSPSVATISLKLQKALQLTDKKGNDLHYPQPLPEWIKRRELLLKKMKK